VVGEVEGFHFPDWREFKKKHDGSTLKGGKNKDVADMEKGVLAEETAGTGKQRLTGEESRRKKKRVKREGKEDEGPLGEANYLKQRRKVV